MTTLIIVVAIILVVAIIAMSICNATCKTNKPLVKKTNSEGLTGPSIPITKDEFKESRASLKGLLPTIEKFAEANKKDKKVEAKPSTKTSTKKVATKKATTTTAAKKKPATTTKKKTSSTTKKTAAKKTK